jgi:putative ABC transport system ATP-binding protein
MADEGNGGRAPIIRLQKVRKVYHRDQQEVPVLEGIDLEVQEGAFEALMGPSGSGKTTLLNLIAGIDRVTSGIVEVAGTDITTLDDSRLADWRARNVGFVFQSFNLMPVLTAAQNVELPLLLTRLKSADRKRRVATALKVVDLADRMDHYPRQLSGGQEQRVAIARAIVTDPTIIVADEPTGALDRKSAEQVLTLLSKLNQEMGKTILMVTHDPNASVRATVQRRLDKGFLVPEETAPYRGAAP